MIRLILFLVVLGVAVWLGMHLHQQPGMLLIAAGGKSYEMTLWVGGALIILAFLTLYVFISLIKGIFGIGGWFSQVGEKRRHRRAREKTNQGLLALAEGHWKEAEKLLTQGAKSAEVPLLNYLSAAKAAQEQGADKRRDEYLSLAHDATKGTDMAVGLTQAQLQLSQGQYEQSLATLKHLRGLAPKHPHVLKLLKTLYIHLRDWDSLIQLLPLLKKQGVIHDEEKRSLEVMAYEHWIQETHRYDTVRAIKDLWRDMPKHLQYEPRIIALYAQRMIDHQENQEAEQVLRACLRKHWDEDLVYMFGHFKSNNPAKALSSAEGWLKNHGESANLLLTCGRLAAQNELWGKAQRYLEACLNIESRPEAFAMLGLIYEKMEKPELSAEYFRKGMLLSTHHEHSPAQEALMKPEDDDE